jgi:hypothetical protein
MTGRRLLTAWVIACAVGELVGFLVPAAVGATLAQSDSGWAVPALVLAGAVEGAVLGVATAFVLRHAVRDFRPQPWVAATAVGAAVAWLLGLLPSVTVRTWQSWPLFPMVVAGAVLAVLLLCSVGAAQAWALRGYVAGPWRWVPASAVAWCAGLAAFGLFTSPLWQEGQAPWLVALIGAAGAVQMAVVMALVSGVFLLRLLGTASVHGAVRGLGDRVPVLSRTATPAGRRDRRSPVSAAPRRTDGRRVRQADRSQSASPSTGPR